MSSGPTMLPVAHHLSTPPEGTTSLAGASAADGDDANHDSADGDANHDSADGWDPLRYFQLNEEEGDSTPSPGSDKPGMRPPRYVGTYAAIRVARKRADKASSSKGSASPSTSIVPRGAEEWDPFKDVIYDLYITQNIILKDVMAIMEKEHNLKATPKMYKNQLSRWGFFKYSVKPRPTRIKSERGDDMSLVTSSSRSSSLSTDGLISPLSHESRQARSVQIGLTAVRDFLNRLIRVDSTAKQDLVIFGYTDPCFRFFTASMELMDQGEYKLGGLLLRRAFIQLEALVSNMTIKSFSDVCFIIPHLLIESGRVDILAHYLRFLAELAVRTNNQPMREVIASLTDLRGDPDAMIRFVMELTKANSDTIAAHTDAKSLVRTRKWAHNQYVACQRTCMPNTTAGKGRHSHQMLRVESQSVYWAQHLVMRSLPESDALAELWMRREFPPDFAPRTEALLAEVRARSAADESRDEHLPPPYGRMMECLYIGWLGDYYETVGDWPKAFAWVRRGLEISAGEQYQIWSLHVEGLMRKHGSPDEADELKRRRLNHRFVQEVTEEIEKMTMPSGSDGKKSE